MQRPSRVSTARLIQRRDAWLKKLDELGPMTRGSLVTAQRGGHTAHQLTVSVQGKTHTVYVPKDMVEMDGHSAVYDALGIPPTDALRTTV